MSRRAWLLAALNLARLGLLRIRVQIGRPLPAMLTTVLTWLDGAALRAQRGRQ